MVTSKVRTGSKAGAIALLFSSAVMLFVLLFGGSASADQAATTTNAGGAGAATGGNAATGNGTNNGATSNQKATSTKSGGDTVAPNSGTTSNSSTGNASVTTGDATATGNSATNNDTQVDVVGHNGAVVLGNQNATVTNIGGAVATTGGNTAIGNNSNNTATNKQNATATGGKGDSVATNDATVQNNSGGDARIVTGDATATGSTSNNTVMQSKTVNCDNCLGVVVDVHQNSNINNIGFAFAGTGGNNAIGNNSTNTATNTQNAKVTKGSSGDVVASNTDPTSNTSTGNASIMTGDATAVGNVATNNVGQSLNVNAPGANVIVLAHQRSTTNNVGIAIANTGLNTAVGNNSFSIANNVQGAVSGAGPPNTGDVVASNDGTAMNNSTGNASISTGNAMAAGNRSTTNLTQAVNVNTTAHALVLSHQNATVNNIGFALANTGGNAAIGNLAISVAADAQTAKATNKGAGNGDTVAANFGTTANTSNGSAAITTGNAAAAGNESTTNVSQAVNANMTGGLVLPRQTANVTNAGIGISNTGLNLAIGAVPVSVAVVAQNAVGTNKGSDQVASNFGDSTNTSNGSASIVTGNADSIGNASAASTNVSQTVNTNGADMVLTRQTANTTDFGVGVSNTGLNAAIGSTGILVGATVQNARTLNARGDAVASNFGDASNNSNGTASITTGNANAVGSAAHTTIAQNVNANGANTFLLTTQRAATANIGIGIANTGLNLAIGSVGISVAVAAQAASVLFGNVNDTVAANFGSTKNTTNGSASIHTGNAAAVGTRSTTNIAQSASLSGTGFTLPRQTANATSIGVGIANTGGNIAIGSVGINVAVAAQTARIPNPKMPNAGDQVASNDGTASNNSNGSAEIWTGSANAIGNDSASTTNISQAASSNGGGFMLVNQIANVNSTGVAVANSGLNLAIGSTGINVAVGVQNAAITKSGIGNVNAGDLVASNTATDSNTSNGTAKIVTGPSTAVGNASTTNVSQTANHDGTGFSLVNQTGRVNNTGVAIASSGLNVAIGAIPVNVAVSLQNAAFNKSGIGNVNVGDVVTANSATTSNNSNGSATIITGASSATGSQSNTTLNQAANTNITGGGFALVNQTGRVNNTGVALGLSGGNVAVGNGAINVVADAQNARVSKSGIGNFNAGDVAAVNNATNTNNSNGSASVQTGSVDVTGNKSSTTLNQAANTNISGSGFGLYNQGAVVNNIGVAAGISGLNAVVGNGSTNLNGSGQAAGLNASGIGNVNITGDVVASNSSDGGSTSDGTATLSTGNVQAIGNDSADPTVINQAANTNIGGSGFAINNQLARVNNVGIGIGVSGLNVVAGNVSQNGVTNTQTAAIRKSGIGNLNIRGDAVTANSASAWNQSNGTASATTGDVNAIGNHASTTVNQLADNNIDHASFTDVDHAAAVTNFGVGIGISGLNSVTGNASTNTNIGPQTAVIASSGIGNLRINGDAVANNTATLSNKSDGNASLTTGQACGFGNISTTEVNASPTDDSVARVFNVGIGIGVSGLNAAVGNMSNNNVTDTQTAHFVKSGIGNLTASSDVVAANSVSSTNWSNGTATLHTGMATGYGNTSTTMIHGNSLVVNFGFGFAGTGANAIAGNASTNTITSKTVAGFVNTGIGNLNLGNNGVASNAITEANTSTGTANATTGDAFALGNRSATGTAAQPVDDPLGLTDQVNVTINFGLAFATTGGNVGVGNSSNNTTTHNATATAPGGITSNVADLSNTSDGSANIHTGNAVANGNIASNATCQGVDFGPSCPQPSLPPLPPCECFPHVPGVTPPTGQTTPTTPPAGNKPVSLPNTGGSVEGLALLGLLLLAIGVFLRRKARTA